MKTLANRVFLVATATALASMAFIIVQGALAPVVKNDLA